MFSLELQIDLGDVYRQVLLTREGAELIPTQADLISKPLPKSGKQKQAEIAYGVFAQLFQIFGRS